MTILMYALGVLFAAIGVGLSIALHELGHLVPAKRFGVKVTQYMIGFGPTLWSRRVGETEYGLKALPLGGYINMIGGFPPKDDHNPNVVRGSSAGRVAGMVDSDSATRQVVAPEDADRVFYKLPWWKKVVIMAAGPCMNLVIATVLLGGVVTLYGTPQLTGTQISSVVECVRPATAAGDAKACTPADTKAPAAVAGLRPGDRFVSVDGHPVTSPADVSDVVRPSAGKALTVVVEREGTRRTITVTPIRNELPVIGQDGKAATSADGSVRTETVGYLGVANAGVYETQRQPVTAVPGIVGDGVVRTARVIYDLPARMTAVAKAAFGSGPREADSPMSVVGVGRVAGEVASGQVQGIGGVDAFVTLVNLLAGLNVALFVFNLVPLTPLDGGHIVGALWEGMKRGTARALGRPDPGYVDVTKALPLTAAMSLLLVSMSLLLMYADIVRPVKIGG